jgi:hypothetical protein
VHKLAVYRQISVDRPKTVSCKRWKYRNGPHTVRDWAVRPLVSQSCAGQHTPPLLTGVVHASITDQLTELCYQRVLTGSCKCFRTVHHTISTRFHSSGRTHTHCMTRANSLCSGMPGASRTWVYIRSAVFVYTRESSLNPNSNTLERNRPQHDRPAACAIA